ncbi:MAG: hypothetical protein V3573_13165 [Desulfovibrionaceae bacterium]
MGNSLHGYLKRRALRTQRVDVHAAMKAWGSPHPIEIVFVNKQYASWSGCSYSYNEDRKNVYFNIANFINKAALRNRFDLYFSSIEDEAELQKYQFSWKELEACLKRVEYRQCAAHVYAHECAHKFLSINHDEYRGHGIAFSIVNTVLLMRLEKDVESIFRFYNFHEKRQPCFCFKKYGPKTTLKALRVLVLEAAKAINDDYIDIYTCCEKAVGYHRYVESEQLVVKLAAKIRRKEWTEWTEAAIALLVYAGLAVIIGNMLT